MSIEQGSKPIFTEQYQTRPSGPSVLERIQFNSKKSSSDFIDLKFELVCKDSQFDETSKISTYNVKRNEKPAFLAIGVFSQFNIHYKAEYNFRRHCSNLKKLQNFRLDNILDPLFRFPAFDGYSNDEILEFFEIKTYHIGILTEKLSYTLENHLKKNKLRIEESQIIALVRSLAEFTGFCHKNNFAIHNFSPQNLAIKEGKIVFIRVSDCKFFNSENEKIDFRSDFLAKCFPQFSNEIYNPKKADAYFIGLLSLSLAIGKNLFNQILNKNERENYLNEIKDEMPDLFQITKYALNALEDSNSSVFDIFKKSENFSSEKFICPMILPEAQKELPVSSNLEKAIENLTFDCNVGKTGKIKEEINLFLSNFAGIEEAEMSKHVIPLVKLSQFLIHSGAFDTTSSLMYLIEKCLRFLAKEGANTLELETEHLSLKAALKFEKRDFEDLEEILKKAFTNINSFVESFRYSPNSISNVLAGVCCFYQYNHNTNNFNHYRNEWNSILNNISCPVESLRKIAEVNGNQLFSTGDFFESQNQFSYASEYVEKAFDTLHPDYVFYNLKIAQALLEQGNGMHAFEYANKSFEAMLQEFGIMHRLSIPALTMLGAIYFRNGQYSKAQNLYEKAAEVFRNICGEQNPGYCSVISNIAIIHSKLGNHMKAMKFIKLAKELKENILASYPAIKSIELKITNRFIEITDGYDSEYLRIFNNFGLFKSNIGEKINSEISLIEAYSISEELKKIHSNDFFIKKASSEILMNLAILNEELGRTSVAKKYFENCDKEFSSIGLEYNHVDRFKVRFNLAKLYTDERNFKEAKSLYSRLEEDFATKCTLDAATLLNNIGAMHFLCNEKSEAESYFKRSYEMKLQIYKTQEKVEVAASLCNLALVDEDDNNAIEKFSRALEIMKLRYSDMAKKNQIVHHDIATIENNIGLLLLKKKQFDRALEMLINSRDKKIQIYGGKHHEIGTLWNNIGICYYSKGDFSFAKESFLKSLEIKSESLREGHPSVRDTLFNLVLILEKADKKSEAKLLIDSQILRAKTTYKKLNDSEEFGDFYYSIAELYDLLKETPKATKYYSEAQEVYSRTLGNYDEKTKNVMKMVQSRRDSY